ncbi:hypothetical protein ACN47E_000837 [Coniothyrium glycines]
MAGTTHFFKTILIPLFLALALYLLTTLLLLPLLRRHRTRYAQYLPLSPSRDTAPWRSTLASALYNLFAPSSWRRAPAVQHDDELFDDEEGEGMVGFDPFDERRREALERRRSTGPGFEQEQRVGRDLEEGFKDDSDDDDEQEGQSDDDEDARRAGEGMR